MLLVLFGYLLLADNISNAFEYAPKDETKALFDLHNVHIKDIHKQNQTELDITYLTLKDLCFIFNVQQINCSCLNPHLFELCKFRNKAFVTKTFECDKIKTYIIGAFNILSSLIGLLGNGLVIGLSIAYWNDLPRFRRLVTLLAISDFLFASLQLFVAVPQTWTCHWCYGVFMCKTLRSLLSASANIAIGFMLIIALDRYFCILWSSKHILSSRRLRAVSFMNVLCGLISVIPQAIVLQLGEFNTCSENWRKEQSLAYSWFLFIFYFVIPIIIISTVSFLAMRCLRKLTQFGQDFDANAMYKSKIRMIAILITIIVLFVLLVLPNRLIWLVNDHYGLEYIGNHKVHQFLSILSEVPYGFHSAVNPIIYSIVDLKFRKQLVLFFRRRQGEAIRNHTRRQSLIPPNNDTIVDRL